MSFSARIEKGTLTIAIVLLGRNPLG
jgi:hypothetical protein